MHFSHKIFLAGTVLGLTLLSTTGCKEKAAPQKGGGGERVMAAKAYVVTPQEFYQEYATSGTLLANESVEIHPEISGRVTGIHFTEGSKVQQGQLLVQLYDDNIKAQIQKLKAQKKLQAATQKRQKSLLDIGGISQQEYETTETQLQSLDADIAYAEAQLRSTRIYAPFSGTIGIRNISVGAVISPTTVVTSLQQTHPLKMDFNVPDQYRNEIAKGKEVLFSISGQLDTLSGKIIAVEPGADATTRTIRVRAIVPNPKEELIPGAFAHVIVPLGGDNNAILVPSQSVIPTTKEKLIVKLVEGKAKMVIVQPGTRTADKVEILSGIQQGDTILTTGLMQVKEGMPVKVSELLN